MDNSQELADLEAATRNAGIPESSPAEALPKWSVSEPPDTFWKVLWGVFSDSRRTDNVIRLAVFSCVLVVSMVAATMGAYSMASSDKDNKPAGVAVLTTVVTGLLGLAAGAGLR